MSATASTSDAQRRAAQRLGHPCAERAGRRSSSAVRGASGNRSASAAGGQADADADPADERVAAEGEQRAGRERGRHLDQQLGGGHPAVDPDVGCPRADGGQPVVDQGLARAGHQRAADAPDDEAEREGPDPGAAVQTTNAAACRHAGQDDDAAPRPPVGERAGGHLGDERR